MQQIEPFFLHGAELRVQGPPSTLSKNAHKITQKAHLPPGK